jgi:hypothetical protein
MGKECTGNIYVVSGKKWCVGEKKVSKKWGTKKSKKKVAKKSRKARK